MKNEGEDLVEWLCFHRRIGVERFVIFDDHSTDATRRLLESVPFADCIDIHEIEGKHVQIYAFRKTLARYRDELDWVAFLDGDEFLTPTTSHSILDGLAELESEGVSGVGFHWRVFGSSGHEERPDGLATQSFTRRAPDRFKANRHVKSVVKSVVRIRHALEVVSAHYIRVEGRYLVDGEGEAPSDPDFRGMTASTTTGRAAIHHYITKSRSQCLQKIARGRPLASDSPNKHRPPSYFETYDRNDVEDLRAAELVSPIAEQVRSLRDGLGRD
jgi:hypothetical protein